MQDTQGVAAAWGEQVHTYFEYDVKRRNGTPLTEEEAKFIATNAPNFTSAVPWLDTLFEMQADACLLYTSVWGPNSQLGGGSSGLMLRNHTYLDK